MVLFNGYRHFRRPILICCVLFGGVVVGCCWCVCCLCVCCLLVGLRVRVFVRLVVTVLLIQFCRGLFVYLFVCCLFVSCLLVCVLVGMFVLFVVGFLRVWLVGCCVVGQVSVNVLCFLLRFWMLVCWAAVLF